MQTKRIIRTLSELPTAPSTIGTMVWNETGDWRYVTPLVADKLAPCSQSCPAGIPIPRYLGAVSRGDVEGSLGLLVAHNPLPSLTGRLCYHPCQAKCVRRKADHTIAVQKMERFLGDMETDPTIDKDEVSDQRVMIVGSGPLGLSCAFFLGCRGYQVSVLDPSDRAGGALVGLPPGKLEPHVLAREINRLVRLADIRLETGAAVDFNRTGELASKADLVIIDPTGVPGGLLAGANAVPCNPFDDEVIGGTTISVGLPRTLAPFKAPMIAHYIAAGRLLARKVSDGLGGERGDEPAAGLSPRPTGVGDVKIERLSASGPPGETEAGQDGAWNGEQATREASRCLSCGTCNLCLLCVSYCPDASIRTDRAKTTVAIDLDHCKGCGICAYECPRGVITMEDMKA